MDVLEIDGASNNSVDDVRELREAVRYVPTEGSHRIYIIDEVHMLSTSAFNALLKTLEEPPERVVFIFATTEVQEVPETILSRCQRFNFRRIPTGDIAAHLTRIAETEGVAADEEALYLLARRADGALRDAQSFLDQVVSYNPERVTAESARQVLGLVDRTVYFDLTAAIATGDAARVLDLIAAVVEEGGDVEELIRGLLEHMGHLLFTKVQASAAKLEVSDTERSRYEETAPGIAEEDLLRILHALMDLESGLRRSLQPRFRVEVALVRLARMGRAVDVGRLLAKLEALPASGAGQGGGARAAAPSPPPPTSTAPPERADPPAPAAGDAAVPPGQTDSPAPAAGDAAGPSGQTDLPSPADGDAAVPLATTAAQSGVVGATSQDPDASGPVTNQAPPPTTETAEPITLERIRAAWHGVVEAVRRTQPSAANFLQEGAVKAYDGGVLVLGYSPENSFHMTQVTKSRVAIEGALAEALGQPLRLRCEEDGDQTEAPSSRPDGETVDPALRSVLDALDGEVV